MSDLDMGPKSGQPCKSQTYIMQTISRKTLINLVMGRMEGKEAAGGKKKKSETKKKKKSNKYFISF